MLVYMDDIIVIGNSPIHIQSLVTKLNAQSSLKRLSNINYFLGIKVSQTSQGGMFLSQTKYIRDLLEKTNMSEAKSLPTPIVSNMKLTKQGLNYLSDPTYYRLVIGAL